MLRELESPGFIRILIYLVVVGAVGLTLLYEFEAEGIVFSFLQGSFRS